MGIWERGNFGSQKVRSVINGAIFNRFASNLDCTHDFWVSPPDKHERPIWGNLGPFWGNDPFWVNFFTQILFFPKFYLLKFFFTPNFFLLPKFFFAQIFFFFIFLCDIFFFFFFLLIFFLISFRRRYRWMYLACLTVDIKMMYVACYNTYYTIWNIEIHR